jgi:hypothetical protein
MPRIRYTRAQRLEREMRAQFILDECIASAKWLEFKTHLTNIVCNNQIKCPLCRNINNINFNDVNVVNSECIICCQENKPLLQLPCYSTHCFCRECLERLIT